MTTLTDPVEAFFSGIHSVVGRVLLAFGGVMAGFGVCLVSAGWPTDAANLWALLTVGVLFWWGMYGGWFFVGLFALIGIFAFLWSFAYDYYPKLSFFGVFNAAVIYYSPLTFFEHRWLYALGLCLSVSFCYWVLPYLFRRLVGRKAQSFDGSNANQPLRR